MRDFFSVCRAAESPETDTECAELLSTRALSVWQREVVQCVETLILQAEMNFEQFIQYVDVSVSARARVPKLIIERTIPQQ